jgi:DNA-binding NtrC family response regulator
MEGNDKNEGAASAGRVLIVDDESVVRFSFRAVLQKSGFTVEEADGAQRALDKIHEFAPQVVLLDVLMPGVTGNELLETIKEWKPEIHVIMVTSVDTEELKKECLSKGAFEVMIKPVSMEQLVSTIRKALG